MSAAKMSKIRYTQVNGEYSQLVDRDQSINVFDFAADTLTTGISFLPDHIEHAFVNTVASCVGWFFAIKDGHGFSEHDFNDMISSFVGLVYSFNPFIQIQQTFENVFNFFNNLFNGNNSDSSEQYSSTNRHSDFYIKLKQLHGASMNLDSISRNCKIIVNELKGVPLEQLLVYSSIITVKNSLESTVREIDSLSVALSNISDLYSNTEHSISAMIR